MRIIAGKWRGRRIAAPDHDRTRPILDRAKTVLFDVLGHRLAEPGHLPGLAVIDLFAGSGAIGIECLSRGARHCLFVERDRATAGLLKRNLADLQAGPEAHLIQADATALRIPPPPTGDNGSALYSLVFVDPPYRFLTGQRPAPPIRRLLTHLADHELIAPDALIVLRHEHHPGAEPDLAPLVEVDRRVAGSMVFRLLQRPENPGEGAP